MKANKPCFLDTKAWRDIPEGIIHFPLLPESPQLQHTFFSHLAAIPGLLSRAKMFNPHTSNIHCLAVVSHAYTLRHSLKLWYAQYTTSDDGIMTPILVKVPTNDQVDPFDPVYFYNSVLAASMITTYYAYLILLNQEIDRLLADSRHVEENSELAREICRSVNYCSRAGYCGVQTLRVSLPIAYTALSGTYQKWIETWLEKIECNALMNQTLRL